MRTTSLRPLSFDMLLARCSVITLEELNVHELPAAQYQDNLFEIEELVKYSFEFWTVLLFT